MNEAVLAEGGTVMLYVGDAVMATFGDPLPQADHAQRALAAARSMHSLQEVVNRRWEEVGLPPFHLGIGLSTGEAAAAVLGSEERLEYTVVGDTVNLAQRLQQLADPGETVLSEATWLALSEPPAGAVPLGAQTVKGRSAPVVAYKIGADWQQEHDRPHGRAGHGRRQPSARPADRRGGTGRLDVTEGAPRRPVQQAGRTGRADQPVLLHQDRAAGPRGRRAI
jgi:class 3 adenylate cyclase